jgi:hypothetical protein
MVQSEVNREKLLPKWHTRSRAAVAPATSSQLQVAANFRRISGSGAEWFPKRGQLACRSLFFFLFAIYSWPTEDRGLKPTKKVTVVSDSPTEPGASIPAAFRAR